MDKTVYCHKCNKAFDVDYPDYWESKEETTFTVIKCPYCFADNAIYFSVSVDFHAAELNEEDKENFKSDIEDKTWVGKKSE